MSDRVTPSPDTSDGPEPREGKSGAASASARNAEAPGAASVTEEQVAQWLAAHPEFLIRRPDVLARLELEHPCGDATSLIEHQVRVLRQDNRRLRERLDELLAVARQNDATAERLHELALEVLSAEDLDGALSALRAGLREGFRADAVGVLLIADEGAPGAAATVLHPDDERLAPFAAALDDGAPRCGQLPAQAQETLFGEAASRLGSAAWIPLVHERAWGIVGIGSDDPERFHPGQGTVFLRRLGALAGRILVRHLGSG